MVCGYDGGAGGEIIGGVCAIVGGDYDIDVSFRLDEWPEWHCGISFSSVYDLDLRLSIRERRGRVLVERVRVGSVEISGDRAVGVEDDGLKCLSE